MKRLICTLFAIVVLSSFGFAQKEEKRVRKSFESYKNSLLGGQGREAIKYVTSSTLNYYDRELQLIISGDSSTIDKLSVMDKLTVFIARHKIPHDTLTRMTGIDFFIYAIDNGMIGKNSVATAEIGDVQVDGETAKGQMISNGEKIPLYFQFFKESSEWKVDLTSIFPQTNEAFKKMLSQEGVSENDYLFQLLESVSGRKVTHEIWRPIK